YRSRRRGRARQRMPSRDEHFTHALEAELVPDLSRIRRVVLDMDGTIYLGGTLLPHSLPFLASLSRLGIGVDFVTNNCSHSRTEYVERLRILGIEVEPTSITTSA